MAVRGGITTVMSVPEVLETYADSLRLLTAAEYCRLAEEGWFVDELMELLVVQLLGRYKVRVDGPFVASELSVPEPDSRSWIRAPVPARPIHAASRWPSR